MSQTHRWDNMHSRRKLSIHLLKPRISISMPLVEGQGTPAEARLFRSDGAMLFLKPSAPIKSAPQPVMPAARLAHGNVKWAAFIFCSTGHTQSDVDHHVLVHRPNGERTFSFFFFLPATQYFTIFYWFLANPPAACISDQQCACQCSFWATSSFWRKKCSSVFHSMTATSKSLSHLKHLNNLPKYAEEHPSPCKYLINTMYVYI